MTETTGPEKNEAEAPGPAEAWAICCSGGGIRSASYCLGALQRLEEGKFLDKTKLILGVSGGSYIAASRALVAHRLGRDAGPPAYVPGTPEEQHLRDNTRYLAPDAKTLLAGVLSLLLGVAVTLVLVLTPLFAAAHIWGWLLRSQGVLTYTAAAQPGAQWTAAVTGTTWFIWPVIAAVVTLIIFVWWWATLIPDPGGSEQRSQVAVKSLGWAAFIALVLALAMLAVPELVAWLSGSHSGALKTVLDDLGFGAGAAWTPATLVAFVAAVVAVSQSAQKALAKYNLLGSSAAAQGANAQQTGLMATVAAYVRTLLLPWLASVLLVLAGLVAGLRWVKDGAAAGFTRDQIWEVVAALAVILAARILTDANRISLHDFYRWRLASAYAITRKTSPQDGTPAPFGVNNSPGTRLSELRSDGGQPRLVICATANINAKREVPVGRGGLSFTFDPWHATLRGPDSGPPLRARTEDYEALVGRRRCTLFDVSAISGAAFSPLMGSATRQAYRILFTATGLRLGVWLPHPAIVNAAAADLERQDSEGYDPWWYALWLLAWYVLPHFGWQHRDEEPGGREARLWAQVLRLRRNPPGFRHFLGGLLYRALQPTLGMLYAEAAGHTSYRCTWMCVTDGGHYDNLGLVEALLRSTEQQVTHILVLDASGDQANSWFTLGGAVALARADAAAEITLNPTTMVSPLEPGMQPLVRGQVVRPWVSGTYTIKGPSDARARTIVVCKLGWWSGAPWDVRAYAAGHSTYPTDSTLNQLYDSAEFDAYRELGWSSADLAIAPAKPPAQTAPQPRSTPDGDLEPFRANQDATPDHESASPL
jgi:hypothetical protein